jgi:hypothetical protein
LAARLERRKMAVLTPDTSPRDLLSRVRGKVEHARLTYPERVHLEVMDAAGGLWFLATWEADYSPGDPSELDGKSVVGTDLDEASGTLTVVFSDDTCFTVVPIRDEEDDAIENWQLFTPDGFVLNYGPGERWVLKRASAPI